MLCIKAVAAVLHFTTQQTIQKVRTVISLPLETWFMVQIPKGQNYWWDHIQAENQYWSCFLLGHYTHFLTQWSWQWEIFGKVLAPRNLKRKWVYQQCNLGVVPKRVYLGIEHWKLQLLLLLFLSMIVLKDCYQFSRNVFLGSLYHSRLRLNLDRIRQANHKSTDAAEAILS